MEESGRVAKERRESMAVGEAGVGEKILEEAWAGLGGEVVGQAGVEGRGEARRYRRSLDDRSDFIGLHLKMLVGVSLVVDIRPSDGWSIFDGHYVDDLLVWTRLRNTRRFCRSLLSEDCWKDQSPDEQSPYAGEVDP